jgi:peptidoglycan/xylan/chitin deacetylase (PgdA/CDA1 family)
MADPRLHIPILSYHGMHVDSNDYDGNDHVALARDLRALHAAGFQVVEMDTVVQWHQGQLPDAMVEDAIAITFDDGSWFDFHDLDHPICGVQRSLLNILRDFQEEVGVEAQPSLHASSFVIVSPDARGELDRTCMIGRGWWTDGWWGEAQRSGLMSIESHSWDNLHPTLAEVAQAQQRKGDFRYVDSFEDCEAQLVQSAGYLHRCLGAAPRYFAYPWGQSSDYLAEIYLPEYRDRHGYIAAFTTDPRPVSREDDCWRLPRYMCERDWNSPQAFARLLDEWQR